MATHSVPVRVSGRETDGLRLISPTRADFDELARPMLGRMADLALTAKPHLVIVKNESPRTVVAFAVNWEFPTHDGRRHMSLCQFKCPDAVCGESPIGDSDSRILPGAMTIAGNGFVASPESLEVGDAAWLPEFIRHKNNELEQAVELHIELDAVIFDDGTLVGAGESQLSRDFAAYVSAKQSWYRSIVTTLDAGTSLEEAFRPLDEFRSRPMERPPFTDPLALWTRQAAGDLSRWRNRHGDAEAAAMARRALRKEPFVVHRTPILFDIRQADSADVAAIAEAHVDSINTIGPRHYGDSLVRAWGAHISAEMYERAMARGEVFFIAVARGEVRPQVLGFSSHHVDDGEHRTAVYVRGAAARHGVGSALFRTAEAAAVTAGASSIRVDASYAAVEFYKANGFEVIGDGRHRLESGQTMPCVFMLKTL